MVGAGNDFLIVDAVHERVSALKAAWPAVARAMCERRDGIGADGLLILEASRKADCRMRIFNPDGSEAEMCGNGARCVASYLASSVQRAAFRTTKQVSIETAGGLVAAQVRGNRVRMAMPQPRDLKLGLHIQVDGRLWPLGYVDTGVPHAVAVVRQVDEVNVMQIGRRLRFHPAFHPRGTNVDFIEISRANPDRLKIRTYERGVEGETPACGTGVAAAAVIYALTRSNGRHAARANRARAHRIAVQTRSGETLTVSLRVAADPNGVRVSDVILEGAVRWVCQGYVPWRVREGVIAWP